MRVRDNGVASPTADLGPSTTVRPIPALLTLAMVRALYVPLGERTLFRLISAGRFPPADVRVGGKLRLWRRETVERWIEAAGEARSDAQRGRR